MKNATIISPDVATIFSVLEEGGVVVLPSRLGYGILALTSAAVEQFYRLKNRPLDKPSGILATPEIFAETTNSEFKRDVAKFSLPVGLIEEPRREHPSIQRLPSVTTIKGSIAYFFNLDPVMTQLAAYAWERKQLITLSSANKAGNGNSLIYEHLHSDFKLKVDLAIEGDDLIWKQERAAMDTITSTIIDLPGKRLIRDGIYADRVKAQAIALKMIREHLPVLPPRDAQTPAFSSCLFLLAYKKSVYDKFSAIRGADWLVLDLEDGCPADKKDQARDLIEQHAASDTFNHHFVAIRLNELAASAELEKDLALAYTPKIYAFALPMLQTAADVQAYDDKVAAMEERLGIAVGTFKFFPIIETVEGLRNAEAIAKASSRNIGLFLGHADLFSESSSERTFENLHFVRMTYLMAARLANIPAFDTPYENVYDLDALQRDSIKGKAIGLDGKVALNFDQTETINTTFNLAPSQYEAYQNYLDQYQGGCHIVEGKFLAPPVIKTIKEQMKKRVYQSTPFPVKATIGTTRAYGLDYRNAFVGQVVSTPYSTTVDESWITSWQALVQTGNPLETNHHFCLELGLEGRLVPFQLLVNLGLCLMVETFSESSIFHLGISNVVYQKPVYVGDTLRSFLIIDGIVPSSNRKYTIFKTRMVLVNQQDEVVVRMNRNSLFPYFAPADQERATDRPQQLAAVYFDQPASTNFRERLFRYSPRAAAVITDQHETFHQGELVLHSLARPMGLSNSIAYSTLYKNTHPLHINNARYGMDGLVVCGGFIIPIIHAAASRDIRFALDHEIIDTMHINKIHHDDAIGAMTYVIDAEMISDQIECLTLRTFGLKNIDPERDLSTVPIPNEILQSPKIKPQDIEKLCKAFCPQLQGRVCARMTWRLWRVV